MFEEKYKTIGLNIMYYRRALSLTQSELAEKAKMSRARVSDIECGELQKARRKKIKLYVKL